MNILFVNPKTEGYSRSVTAPLGLLSIASFLEVNGFSVRLYDRTAEKVSAEQVFASFSTALVGISLVSYKSLEDALSLSSFFKARGCKVVWGGPLASELPEAVLKNDCVDAVSISEGEETWLELANAQKGGKSDWRDIKGLVLKDPDGGCFYTGQREFMDLGMLPDINWTLVQPEKYFQSSFGCRKMLYLYAAKGCPNNCSFCYNKDFHRCKYRKRPTEALLREIRYLVENYGMDGIYFADELWCRNVRDMHEICDSLKSLHLDFVWGGQTRIGMFGKEDFDYMYEAGCRWIFFGIESGSKKMLEKINKRIAYDKIEQTVADCVDAGIVAIGSFIIGLPGETVADARETVALIEKLRTPMINLNYFILIPGADFYNQLVAEGKYAEITDLHSLEKQDPMQKMTYNFSELPDLDINVIHAHYMWRSFMTSNISVGGKKTSFTKKVVTDALKSIKTGDFKLFVLSMWSAGTELLKIFYYAHAHPKIKKKYGIR